MIGPISHALTCDTAKLDHIPDKAPHALGFSVPFDGPSGAKRDRDNTAGNGGTVDAVFGEPERHGFAAADGFLQMLRRNALEQGFQMQAPCAENVIVRVDVPEYADQLRFITGFKMHRIVNTPGIEFLGYRCLEVRKFLQRHATSNNLRGNTWDVMRRISATAGVPYLRSIDSRYWASVK